MSDSPIESTKELHESKERKPERKDDGLLTMINRCVERGAPRGDDEELSKALEGLYSATRTFVVHEQRGTDSDADAEKVDQAEKSVESLFGRIREERDRAQEDAKTLDASATHYQNEFNEANHRIVELTWEIQSLQAELGRIREELKEALAEVDRLHALSLRLRA